MMKLRLVRRGSKGNPHYRIVVADSRARRDGRFREILGRYHPLFASDHPERIVLDRERLAYWLGVGARPTDRVARFLADADLISKVSLPEQTKKNQPKAKAQERLAEQEEAARAAAQADADVAADADADAESSSSGSESGEEAEKATAED